MSKFDYEAGEIIISKSQCTGCIFQMIDSIEKCKKYEEIPKEITSDKKACRYYEQEGQVKL